MARAEVHVSQCECHGLFSDTRCLMVADAISKAPPTPPATDAVGTLAQDREFIGRALHEECIAYVAKCGNQTAHPFDERPWDDIEEVHREHHRSHADHVINAIARAVLAASRAPGGK